MKKKDKDLAVLQAVEKKHGLLTADFLVMDATSERHPWHGRFTWDDKVAGHRWRIEEARQMIRAVTYTIVEDRQIYKSAAYVRDPDADPSEQGYAPIAKLRTETTRARDVVLSEFERVSAALKRARDVSGTLGLANDIDRMLVTIEGLAGRVGTSSPRRPRVAAE